MRKVKRRRSTLDSGARKDADFQDKVVVDREVWPSAENVVTMYSTPTFMSATLV